MCETSGVSSTAMEIYCLNDEYLDKTSRHFCQLNLNTFSQNVNLQTMVRFLRHFYSTGILFTCSLSTGSTFALTLINNEKNVCSYGHLIVLSLLEVLA